MKATGGEHKAARNELRTAYRTRRQSISAAERQQHASAALAHLLESSLLSTTESVGLFVSTDEEFDSDPFIAHCLSTNTTVALPAITDRATGAMELRRHQPNQPLRPGRLGIPEPSADAAVIPLPSLALLFMPLVAFDAVGARLGMGGGYYDRLLGAVAPTERPLLIGLAHQVQLSATPLPTASWDINLDLVLTEQSLLPFSARGHSAVGT